MNKIIGMFQYFILSTVFIIGSGAQASQGRTAADEIMRDFSTCRSLIEFLDKMSPKMLPGDRYFLRKLVRENPDLKNVKFLPTVIYENGMFQIREGRNETTVSFSDRSKFEFEINKSPVILFPNEVASLRWEKVSNILSKNTSVFHFSFLPVSWAQSKGAPTVTSLFTFAITSRMAREISSPLITKVAKDLQYVELMDKSRKVKSECTIDLLGKFGKWVAEMQVDEISCQSKEKVEFSIFGLDNYKRFITVDIKNKKIEEKITAGGVESTHYYKRAKLKSEDLLGQADKKNADNTSQYEWVSMDSKDPLAEERADQFKDLVNHAISSEYCAKCSTLIKALTSISEVKIINSKKVPVQEAPAAQ